MTFIINLPSTHQSITSASLIYTLFSSAACETAQALLNTLNVQVSDPTAVPRQSAPPPVLGHTLARELAAVLPSCLGTVLQLRDLTSSFG